MQNSIYLLSAVAALVAMWFIWTLGIKKMLLDQLREQLFEIRFELFRLGLSGELPFNSEAYRTVEILLSGLLRFGHRIMFSTYLLSLVEKERAKRDNQYDDVSQEIALRLSRINPETQAKVAVIIQRAHSRVIKYMALSSLFFLSICLVFMMLRLLRLWNPDEAKAQVVHVIDREAYLAESRRDAGLAVAY